MSSTGTCRIVSENARACAVSCSSGKQIMVRFGRVRTRFMLNLTESARAGQPLLSVDMSVEASGTVNPPSEYYLSEHLPLDLVEGVLVDGAVPRKLHRQRRLALREGAQRVGVAHERGERHLHACAYMHRHCVFACVHACARMCIRAVPQRARDVMRAHAHMYSCGPRARRAAPQRARDVASPHRRWPSARSPVSK